MDKKTIIIIAVAVVAFLGLIGISMAQNKKESMSQMFPASEETGYFEEMVDGDPDAPVKIYEYGDYQCDACAPMNPYINDLVEEYDGKVAVVFRTMIMSYHQNGTLSAQAALAASNQGYWKEFKDYIYKNQDDWFYSTNAEAQKQFEEYFEKVTNGKGDMDKFRAAMQSAEVAAKIAFDGKISGKAGVEYTPYFFVEEDYVDQRKKNRDVFLDEMRAKIDEKLAEKGIEK